MVLLLCVYQQQQKYMGNCPCNSYPPDVLLTINQNPDNLFPSQIQLIIDNMRDRHRNQINEAKSQKSQNGGTYRGIIEGRKKSGYGEYFFDKNAYFGMFSNDLPNGQGLMVKGYKDYIKGTFRNGKVDGQAYESINNKQFRGHYSSGNKIRGILTTQQFIYQGSFKNNKFDGYGILQFTNGDRYEGDFENGLYHGDGFYETKQQGSYHGQFRNGLYHGKGVFRWRQNFVYEGEYSRGCRNGFGKFMKGHSIYQGEWINGQPKDKVKSTLTDYQKIEQSKIKEIKI